MSIPHWEAEPAEWDRLKLTPNSASGFFGAMVMPGVWDVETACKRDIDKKKAKGQDGSRLKDNGYVSPELTLTGRLVNADDFETLQLILAKLHPKQKGKSRDVYFIDHPKAWLLGIASVYVQEIKSPSIDNGVMTIQISAVEWVPEPKAVKKNPLVDYTPSADDETSLQSLPYGQSVLPPDGTANGP